MSVCASDRGWNLYLYTPLSSAIKIFKLHFKRNINLSHPQISSFHCWERSGIKRLISLLPLSFLESYSDRNMFHLHFTTFLFTLMMDQERGRFAETMIRRYNQTLGNSESLSVEREEILLSCHAVTQFLFIDLSVKLDSWRW